MRFTSYLGLAIFAATLILHTSLATEPTAWPAEPPTTDRSPDDRKPPTQADLLTDARLKLIEQGLAKSAPVVQPPEAVILLTTLKSRIDKTLAAGNDHAAFAKNEPNTLDDFDKLFWSMHVFSNQFGSAIRFYDYTQELLPLARKFKPKASDKIDLSALQTDWARLKSEMKTLYDKFVLRDRDLRIARLNLADKVITDGKDVAERLLAALALDMDGDLLPELLAKDDSFPPEQTEKIKDTIKHAREVAGPELLQKSRALFTGLHWWVRGRYGIGSTAAGLLKDPAALKSNDAMFGLIMPITMPSPTPPTDNNPVPFVDRRHHYLWQFETRQIIAGGSNTTTKTKQFVPLAVSVTTMTHFY